MKRDIKWHRAMYKKWKEFIKLVNSSKAKTWVEVDLSKDREMLLDSIEFVVMCAEFAFKYEDGKCFIARTWFNNTEVVGDLITSLNLLGTDKQIFCFDNGIGGRTSEFKAVMEQIREKSNDREQEKGRM
jgi:hypothetical protein